MWKQVWRLRVPNQVKHLLWRTLQNVLPCCWALTYRHIGDDSSCPCCHDLYESIIHALWGCREVKMIWKFLFLNDVINIWHEPTFADLWCHIILACLNFDLEIFAYFFWLIWLDRNAQMHGQKGPNDLYTTAHCLSINLSLPSLLCIFSPSPILISVLPYLVSTSVWKHRLGAVVRNVHEDLMGAISVPIIGCLFAKITELLAIREGLQFAWKVGYDSLVVETDAKIAINDIVLDNEVFGGS